MYKDINRSYASRLLNGSKLKEEIVSHVGSSPAERANFNYPSSAATPVFQISQSESIIDMMLPYDYLMEVQEEGICPQCSKPSKSIDFQFSFGVYAGVMCTNCAISGYRDSCGHKARPGSPRELEELGETYWEE